MSDAYEHDIARVRLAEARAAAAREALLAALRAERRRAHPGRLASVLRRLGVLWRRERPVQLARKRE